jgi:hypothetical protein
MKTNKPTLVAVAVAIVVYVTFDFTNTRFDRFTRLAAGESRYEKSHIRKK